MTLDITWFGYGASLPLVGFFAGTVVSMLLSSFRSVR